LHEGMKKRVIILILIVLIALVALYVVFSRPASAPATTKAPSKTQSTTSVTNKPTPSFNKQKFSLSDSTSVWVVVNKLRPLSPKTYSPSDLTKPNVATNGSQVLRAEAAQATEQMFAAASNDSVHLRVDSAYRSYTTQVSVYNNEVSTYGKATADRESARPGYSEHQTGWAADFGTASGGCSITDCFATTPDK
jgi:D-alanyl-D-alanine carboxypeptidase